MKISRRKLNTLIESFLFEQEDTTRNKFDFDKGRKIPSAAGLVGLGFFLKNELLTDNGVNYLLTDDESIYSIAGGVSNKESINQMASYLRELIVLISITVMAQNKIPLKDVKRTVVVSSLERSPEAQLSAMRKKVKIAMNQGVNPIETVASLYSPENDTSMTQAGYENAIKVVNLLQQGNDDEALSTLITQPVSPHESNNAIDFRAEAGRGDKVLAAIEHLKNIGVFNENLNYIEEDPGGNNHHIHVAAIANPFTEKGKELVRKVEDAKSTIKAQKAFNYMEKVGLFR